VAKKILVADDDRYTRTLLQVILRKEGYEVWPAHDGNEALSLLEQEKPDLIILDAMMRGLDGFGTLKALRTQRATAGLPVVMLSSQHAQEGVVRAWRGGVDLYIEKPFDPQDLTAYIRRIFQERRAASDRRAEYLPSERRNSDRRSVVMPAAVFNDIDRRERERREQERRAGSRRLDFAVDEAA